MIVTCENCGKGYQIDPKKIGKETITFQCDACNHVITVSQRTTTPGDSSPLTPDNLEVAGNPGYLDMAEEVVETILSMPEAPQEVSTEAGFEKTRPLDLGASEHLNLAEEVVETVLSTPETPKKVLPEAGFGESEFLRPDHIDLAAKDEGVPVAMPETAQAVSSEAGFGERGSLNLATAEYIDLAAKDTGAPVSIPETTREVPPISGFGELRSLNLGVPEYINLAEEGIKAPLPKSEIGLRDKVFFFVPICLIIVAGVLLLIL